ncbi:Cardiolipin synthetase [Methanosarcina siciliae C2J]|uniref:Cardiolipin synthetase n=1 Tax=Methanosarcina siciliae C2J TaxID=1434118 RepID=A0A0E3LDH7_9EURY|nr:Cardiolipin synthetase [Methanosarcina siciliae C2J]
MGTVIADLINSAEDDLFLTAYILSNPEIIEHMHSALARGVRIRVIMASPERQNVEIMDKIRDLEKKYPHMKLVGITDLTMHAKVLVSDRKTALVSSANLTFSGMTKNYEMGLLVNSCEIAQQIENVLLKIWKSA